ncbi:hypothetical protein TSOC_000468 [Tetrabaena socialis]|uniref:Microbial-type PARG catalytic domain-containing protein n=1 Tax=Tetrabaena socialis TaxID=47790 RepID=A0A2J8AJB2_9CHLO|nr:hypothetical protein TSOC_000468 [Tetrabaena socialis]|eukprot:PNH12600.1 hypothetical protein TSOC_000468 [Tetrabaena socialis]
MTAPPKKIGSTKHAWQDDAAMEKRYSTTIVSVVNKDLIDAGRSGAAEESMFRRSNYFRTLTIDLYPIKKDEAIYSPSVTVFKDGPELDFARCQPFDMSFIACPGLRHPILTEEGRLKAEDVEVLERKIELIFQVAWMHGHRVIVLGAMGCGAWKNNPIDVAEAFKSISSCMAAISLSISTFAAASSLSNIRFTIFSRHNNRFSWHRSTALPIARTAAAQTPTRVNVDI